MSLTPIGEPRHKDHHCHSAGPETSPRTHHLPHRVRLRRRAPGGRGRHRHGAGGRFAGPSHARLRKHALGHHGRDAASREGGAARREKRAAGRRHAVRVVSDGSQNAVSNAARFVKEGGAEVVKIEGGEKRADLIRQIIDAEIPVAGHIGLTPQSVNVMGGYKVQGQDLSGIEQLMRDAVALDRAGVACLYLEGIPREVAAMITAEVSAPTIGIGAGPECDGQVLVFHDILNLTFGPPAKFVRRYGDAAALITNAVQAFRADVRSHQYPSDEESYHFRRTPGPGSTPFWHGSAQCSGRITAVD